MWMRRTDSRGLDVELLFGERQCSDSSSGRLGVLILPVEFHDLNIERPEIFRAFRAYGLCDEHRHSRRQRRTQPSDSRHQRR